MLEPYSITAPVREGAAQGLRMAQEGAAMLGRTDEGETKGLLYVTNQSFLIL